jgi:putative spermidine/putrescine transport system ATP-binding protein
MTIDTIQVRAQTPGRAPAAAPAPDVAGPLVRFLGVQKTYDGDHLAVDNLNLSISSGEFITLLGPSGSGKTTTLMMLAGFEAPTAGEIFVAGRSVTSVPPYRRNIGMVFQNYALFPHMTVEENIAFPLSVRRVPKAEIGQRVKRALELVHLDGYGYRRPAQLSGGQQQRIAFARALVFEPDLVLMDEPLGALDRQLREHMQFEIKRLHEELGLTVVYVTHDQSEALTMSNRIAVFRNGIIQQLATPTDIYECPKNSFVAQFIGENNRVQGAIRSIENGTCMVEVGGHTVRSTPVNIEGTAGRTTLSIRPERVVIDPPDDGSANLFDGVVRETIYLGDHLRLRVGLFGLDDFIVKVPNMSGHGPLTVGDTVRIGWRVSDCHALDPD